jgi:hypothetical protein
MENALALVNKKTKVIENIIVVDSYDNADLWANENTLAIPDENQEAIVYGTWDGKKFKAPTEDYLIEIGVSKPIEEVDA